MRPVLFSGIDGMCKNKMVEKAAARPVVSTRHMTNNVALPLEKQDAARGAGHVFDRTRSHGMAW